MLGAQLLMCSRSQQQTAKSDAKRVRYRRLRIQDACLRPLKARRSELTRASNNGSRSAIAVLRVVEEAGAEAESRACAAAPQMERRA